jgi:C-terminal processing protease CtpA/Prc
LLDQGVESLLKVYLSELHALPSEKWDVIIPFVRQHFFNVYEIGIKVSDATPAIQILKIHPNSPAQKSGKLKVGDAILSISPMNDDIEIDTLRMPINKFVSLLLGRKDSKIRLHVQHFDLTFEDIVISRG